VLSESFSLCINNPEFSCRILNTNLILIIAVLFTFAIMVTASNMATTAQTAATAATTTSNTTVMTNNNTTTISSFSSPELKFSPRPVWEEQITDTSETPINETHIIGTFAGNGTLNLPNSAEEAINFTSNGSVIGSITEGIGVGEEVISTVDGTESATQKFFGIARFNMEDGNGRAIVIALVNTNSTGRLAPLDGMILVGTHEQNLNSPTAIFRYWEWESRIPLPTDTTTAAITIPEEFPPQMDDTTTTTTTTNATTAADDIILNDATL
jgi:hypothetical protein